jgi:putative transposase
VPDTLKKQRLWKYRPFTRVVQGFRGFKTVMAYVKLNELEAQGVISYSVNRLKGLSPAEWELLWS